jgi:type VI secretion system VasD/TssJ family lipoprotein
MNRFSDGSCMSAFLNRLLLVVLMVTSLAGCGVTGPSKQDKQDKAKAEVKWPYAKNAIMLELASDVDLNFYSNRAHTIVLGVLQFGDEKDFPKLLTQPADLIKALTSGNLPGGALQLDRYVVSPGARLLLEIDRVQDAKFVGIVAGYYQFDVTRAARYFRIPLNIQSTGIITKDYKAAPSVLALRLALGSQRIVNAESLTHDADAPPQPKEEVSLTNDNLQINLSPEVMNQAAQRAGALIRLGR